MFIDPLAVLAGTYGTRFRYVRHSEGSDAGPAILAYFLFFYERKAHKDYMQSPNAMSPHYQRMHTATVPCR
jgi:hypothetical protein